MLKVDLKFKAVWIDRYNLKFWDLELLHRSTDDMHSILDLPLNSNKNEIDWVTTRCCKKRH